MYLVYISRTCRSIASYLKVIHQTLDSWRKRRKEDGWKLSPEELRKLAIIGDYRISDSLEVPVKLEAVPKLSSDLKYVGVFLAGDIPYRVSGRVKRIDL